MALEEWCSVAGYEGLYSVSSLGRLRREASIIQIASHLGGTARLPRRDVQLRPKRNGYLICNLWRDGKAETAHIHQLVATAFIGPCPSGHQINHRDCDKSNNRPENLEYVTAKGNKEHAAINGRVARGSRHGRSRLTEDAVREIRRTNLSVRYLARRYGVTVATVEKARRCDTWTHVT